MARTELCGPTVLYIAPATGSVPSGWCNGNNANDGDAKTAAFATRQAAWNYAQTKLDLAGQSLTFQLADGVYTDDFTAVGPLLGGTEGTITFQGNLVGPDNCVVNAYNSCFGAACGACYTVTGFKLMSGGGNCINSAYGSRVVFGEIDFGQTDACHLMAWAGGIIVGNGSTYYISGGAQAHFKLDSWGTMIINPCTIDLLAACAFTYFCQAGTGNGCFKNLNFIGTGAGTGSTGAKFAVNEGATVLVGGAGTEYFPGYASSGVVANTAPDFSIYF